jgi:hypothetical protein
MRAMPASDARVQQAIHSFVSDLEAVIRRAALETVERALADAMPPARRASRTAAATSLEPRAKGAKRSAEDVEALKSKLQTYIASHPGQRIEQIGKALGETTKELRLPAQKLIAEKAVKTKGARRAMTYSPG